MNEAQRAGMMSSATPEWATPQWLFDELNQEFAFTLDPCSTHLNAKCEKHYTREDDGLNQPWAGETVWMNPPYGKEIGAWVKKAHEETRNGATTVCLIPSRTDTKWWHTHVMGANEIRFIKGRVSFIGEAASDPAPFPSCLVVFRPTPKATVLRQHLGNLTLLEDV